MRLCWAVVVDNATAAEIMKMDGNGKDYGIPYVSLYFR